METLKYKGISLPHPKELKLKEEIPKTISGCGSFATNCTSTRMSTCTGCLFSTFYPKWKLPMWWGGKSKSRELYRAYGV